MKISKTDLAILDNFQSINDSVIFQEGKKQKTISSGKGIFAYSELELEFPAKFPVYRLGQFLDVVRTFKDPDVEFKTNPVLIKDTETNSVVEYFHSNENLIAKCPNTVALGTPVSKFEISKETLLKIRRIANLLKSEYLKIFTQSGKLFLSTYSESEKSNIKYEIGKSDRNFIIVVSFLNLMIMDDSYDIEFHDSPILLLKMSARNIPIHYYVVAESKHSKVE